MLLTFIGVDAQYFSAVLMPQRLNPADVWFDELYPIRVGKVDPQHTNLTNTSCRLVSVVADLKPGQTMTHRFRFFTGPKKPAILENKEYRLGELIYYGWPIFAAVAVPLTAILHFFYAFVWNYGLAIILLTVLVPRLHVPVEPQAGRRRPEDAIVAAGDEEAGRRSTRTTPRPEPRPSRNCSASTTSIRLSGCLPIFIQMPVFIGLCRCLMVDIELRDAPAVSPRHPLVLEPGRPRHALQLELVHAAVRQQRHERHLQSRPLLQPPADPGDRRC